MAQKSSEKPLRILLVEDNPADAVLLRENILQSGIKDIHISIAESLREAVDHVKNNHVDATLLDLSLPDSFGLETVKRFRNADSDMPIVLLTGIDDEQTGVEAVRMGAQDYLVKGQADGRLIVRAIHYAIERKNVQEELRRARDELELRVQERTRELRRLTSQLALVEEKERRRIASDLHDSVGQILAFASRELKTVKKNSSDKLSGAIGEVCNQLDQAIMQTRTLSFDLSPSILYDLGLEVAIEDLAERFCNERKIKCRFDSIPGSKPLAEDVRILLYRAVRELLINIAKHAHARAIRVSLAKSDNEILITVEDDGQGFEINQLESSMGKSKGFGIFNIRERLGHIGGRMEIESARGKGTKVTLAAPLND